MQSFFMTLSLWVVYNWNFSMAVNTVWELYLYSVPEQQTVSTRAISWSYFTLEIHGSQPATMYRASWLVNTANLSVFSTNQQAPHSPSPYYELDSETEFGLVEEEEEGDERLNGYNPSRHCSRQYVLLPLNVSILCLIIHNLSTIFKKAKVNSENHASR